MPAHLSCAEFVELVTLYLEDGLDDETRERFEHHVTLCPGCLTYVDQMRQTMSAAQQVPAPQLSSATAAELLEAFRSWRR